MPKVFLPMPANSKKNYSIGVFDSGLGGLTVVKELMRLLPHENIVYFGDTARVPYGTKSRESIIRFSIENVSFLLRNRVKMIVVACNTSSSVALSILKRSFDLPILGVIRPGARQAVQLTKNKKIGIIATPTTINSEAYTKNIQAFDPSIKVIGNACPLFVPLAEEGWFEKKVTFDVAREYLKPIIRSKADTVILGCTHYPLLRDVVQKVVGKNVVLVDSGTEVAFEVQELLKNLGLERTQKSAPKRHFYVSDQPQHFQKLARQFLGFDIKNVKRSIPNV